MKILYLPKFARQFKKLPHELKIIAIEKEEIFRKNPFDHSLKTHKLRGPLKNFWSFSIDAKNRIIFDFQDDDIVRFYSVGSHDIYY